MSKVTFFNYYHNGDIHLSRGLVRKVIEKIHQIEPQTQFYYAHRNSLSLLEDINLISTSQMPKMSDHDSLLTEGDTTYFNTWYGQQHYHYLNRYGMSFDCLYDIFDDSCKKLWGFSLNDISTDVSSFFPVIDYSKFEIQPAQEWLGYNKQKKIFVASGLSLSGQATNFPITQIISEIASIHKDKVFILSNLEPPLSSYKAYDHHVVKHYKYLPFSKNLPDNVVYSSKIIKRTRGSDLNENAFLSEHCDIIIGRASGAFSFAMTYNNMFKRTPLFLSFSNLSYPNSNKFWINNLLQDKISYTANFSNHDIYKSDEVRDVIMDHLSRI